HPLRLWEIASGQELLPAPAVAGQGCAALAFSPDGKTLASAGEQLSLWELATGKERCRFRGHRGSVTGVAYGRGGNTLATVSRDGTALVWDVRGQSSPDAKPNGVLSGQAMERLWSALASADAGKAYRALGSLADRPRQAVPFLHKHVRLPGAADARVLARLI